MSLTSKIVLSALLVGFTLPAFAQGTSVGGVAQNTTATQAPIVKHAPLVHKVATTPETTKTEIVKPATGSTAAIVVVPSATAKKPDAAKPQVSTGIAQPPVVKTN